MLLGHLRGMDLIPTALWAAAMEGQLQLAPLVRGWRDLPYPSRWDGWLGRFKPWARLALGSRTEVEALDSVRLMTCTTACAGGLDARRHPSAASTRLKQCPKTRSRTATFGMICNWRRPTKPAEKPVCCDLPGSYNRRIRDRQRQIPSSGVRPVSRAMSPTLQTLLPAPPLRFPCPGILHASPGSCWDKRTETLSTPCDGGWR